MKKNLIDIAQELSISIATISRCLNNDATLNIPLETRKLIVNKAHEIGYLENKKIKKPTILINCLLVDEDKDPFFKHLREEAEKYCIENKISYCIKESSKLADHVVSVQGIVAIGTYSDKDIRQMSKICSNITFINSFPSLEKYDSVVIDDRTAVKSCFKYIRLNNKKKVTFLGAEEYIEGEDKPKFNYRKHFFSYYADVNDIEESKINIGSYTYESGYNMGEELLDNLPDTIICASDTIAKGCVEALLNNGIKIPEEVEVIGFNNDANSLNGIKKITTIAVPYSEMSKVAIENCLENLSRKSTVNRRIVLGTKFIARETTRKGL